MANEQNLKPLNKRTQRERKEIAQKGAVASNQAKAHKKVLREAATILLTMPADKEIMAGLRAYKLSEVGCTVAMALVAAQMKSALQGNTAAFNAIRDIVGERPRDNEPAEQDCNIVFNIMPASEKET
ncbi:hypothetical protein [Harryflintia acetispora]|uniref:Uncharacterized protein n=1 Tax=Harryflintia acetispora TaxID=1849041 RepID=A0A9X8ULA9_9FIRM|nr:hypothetical protein [Harryflintia acetispora]TCL44461.1 hypothetical protein EDD78_10279 [Harryflintia acetispora]